MNRFLWMVRNDIQRLKFAAALMMAFGGTPILYYGTEVGLSQPRSKGPHREESRHPMLWGTAQDAELLGYFRQLIAFRQQHPALVYGKIATLLIDEGQGLWLVECRQDSDRVLIAVNASPEKHSITLPEGQFHNGNGERIPELGGKTSVVVLKGRSVALLEAVC